MKFVVGLSSNKEVRVGGLNEPRADYAVGPWLSKGGAKCIVLHTRRGRATSVVKSLPDREHIRAQTRVRVDLARDLIATV